MAESLIRLHPKGEGPPTEVSPPTNGVKRWWAPFPSDDGKPVVTVFVTHRAYVRFCAHAGSDLNHEVGGGLVGQWHLDEEAGEGFVVIETIIPARFTRQGSAFLTFTQDTLVAMHDELEDRHPGKQLVGWYHTHPRMGVFLSSYDVWLHEHFFPEPWQVALVIEPHSRTGGFFIQDREGRMDPKRYFGFNELLDENGASVVHWTNMFPNAPSQTEVGEPEDE